MEALTELLDCQVVFRHLRDLALAYIFALPIAYNRETASRTAGIRTFPLVSIATCAYMLIGYQVLSSTAAEARVLQGLITGMGFIGGGAILKEGGTVKGTATAASLWATGAIGCAVASNRLEIALVISLVTFLTLRLMTPLKEAEAD